MSSRAKRTAVAMTIATLASAWLISLAEGTPAATTTKGGNTMTATATIIDGPPNDDAEIVVRITGQITSSHQFGPRHCRKERAIWASSTSVAGAPWPLGDSDHPTDKNGRFTFTQIKARYGSGVDGGDGPVPTAGGPVTVQLTASSSHAPKSRGDILSSYKCRPVGTSVTVQAPPQPQY